MMAENKRLITLLMLFLSLLTVIAPAETYGMTSTNYQIPAGGINSGGDIRTSAGYKTSDVIGLGIAGSSSSAGYKMDSWIDLAAVPTGTISINSGATYATSTSVTLTLTCSDASGCSEMQFSNDNITYSTPETYATSKAWTLTSGDGTKSVYVKFKNNAGYWSVAYSDTIVLDTALPTTTASPGSGTYTSAQNITLSCSDGTGSGCSTTYYCLGSGCSPTTVYIGAIGVTGSTVLRFYSKDNAGNNESVKTETYTISKLPMTSTNYKIPAADINSGGDIRSSSGYNISPDVIGQGVAGSSSSANYKIDGGSANTSPDSLAPTGSITINNSAAYTNSTAVTLTLSCTDSGSGCSQMRFSNNNVTYSTAETFVITKAWTLDSGDGTKTVYAQFKDYAGNWSGAYSDTIILDMTAPITSASGGGYTFGNWTTTSSVSVTLSGDDGTGSGVASGYPQYCTDTTNTCTPGTSYTGAFNITCSSGSTCTRYVRYRSTDNAGNTEAIKSSQVKQDLQGPTDGTLTATAGNGSVSLGWTGATDSGSGFGSYKLVYQGGATPPSDCTGSALYTGTGTSYDHGGLTNGNTYSYRLCAYDALSNVSAGATASATPTVSAPNSPTGIALSNMKTGGPAIGWNTVSNATSYKIYRSTDNSSWSLLSTVSHPTNSYTDTSAPKSNTLYYWTVTASNGNGESTKPAGVSGQTALIYGWNQISAPYNTSGNSPTTVYGSWASYTWTWISTGNTDPDNNGSWSQNPGIYPGECQFAWVWDDSTVLSASGANNSTPLNVTLIPGWNLISNPTTTNMINIGTNWLVDGSSLSSAISGAKIGGDIYWWNGSTYDSMNIALDNPVVEQWKGYWILNLENVNHTLTIQ